MSEGNKGKGGKKESFIEVEVEKEEFSKSRRLKVEKIKEKRDRENIWFEVLEERDVTVPLSRLGAAGAGLVIVARAVKGSKARSRA